MTYFLLVLHDLDIYFTGEEYQVKYLFKMEEEEAEKLLDKIHQLETDFAIIPFIFRDECGTKIESFDDFGDFSACLDFNVIKKEEFESLSVFQRQFGLGVEIGGVEYIIKQIHECWKEHYICKSFDDLTKFIESEIITLPENNKLKVKVNGNFMSIVDFDYDCDNNELLLFTEEEE